MPELLEFREVFEAHAVVLAIVSAGVALLAMVLTRWMDQRSLDAAHERLTAYEDEVRRLNEERADMLTRLEERGDELRRAKADLTRYAAYAARADVRPGPARPETPVPDRRRSQAAPPVDRRWPEVAVPRGGRRDGPPPGDPDWR